MKLAFDILFYTGMRSGELLTLTPVDIILKKDYVPFEESNVKFYKSGINTKIPPDIK